MIIPFVSIFSHFQNNHFFYLIKGLRLKNFTRVINSKRLISLLREQSKKRANKMIERNDPNAVNKLKNNNFITQLVWANQVLNIMESFLNLLLISIFLGCLWFILCTLQETYLIEFNGLEEQDFIIFNYEKNKDRMLIVVTYFMITTLATVGLGDYKPISNFERILGSFVMLGGVAVFSMIFSRATASFYKIMQIVDPHKEQLAQLDLFFGVLRRFNGNLHIDNKIRTEIEKFLLYSWTHDPNQAMKSDADVKMLL